MAGVVTVLAMVTSMAGVVTVLALLTSMAQCMVTLLGMVPARVLTAALILALVSQAEAVTCMRCHDGVPGCAGGISCPFYQTPIINNDILTSANGSHTEAATGAVTTLKTHSLRHDPTTSYISVLDERGIGLLQVSGKTGGSGCAGSSGRPHTCRDS